jgi:hypothetical protein
VIELARLLMPRYRHVRTLYPILIPTIVVIAVTTSVASGVDLWITGSAVRVMSLAIRFSASILAITCVLLAVFGRIFSEPLARNTVRHGLILSGYFTTLAIGHLVLHLTAANAELVGAVMVGAGTAFYVLWAVMITPDGETSREWVAASGEEIEAMDAHESPRSSFGIATISEQATWFREAKRILGPR